MINEISIKNFKGWADTGKLKLAPITLFFGVNSSGKSSIGQFLMMLKQTAESTDRRAALNPGGVQAPIQLGSFQEMVHKREAERNISFCYTWEVPEKLTIKDAISGKTIESKTLRFAAEIGMADKQVSVQQFSYEVFSAKKAEKALVIGLERQDDTKSVYNIKCTGYDLVKQRGRPGYLKEMTRFYGFPDEMAAYHQNADFVQDLMLRHEQLFRGIYYLGPLRKKPNRMYTWSGTKPESVGFEGENTIAAILASKDMKLNLLKHHAVKASPRKPFEEIIALKLTEMGLIEGFKVNQITENRQDYEVKIRTTKNSDWVDLPDVGFGISQVLPVLVQIFYAPANAVIIMEQPEIHLHPSAQAALADVMIDAVRSKVNGQSRNIQLIIETHSEYFLRRLQRRIAEERISNSDVTAWFANMRKESPQMEPLEIDEYGNILNWPENFFGDEMGDIAGHTKAALAKRKKQAIKK